MPAFTEAIEAHQRRITDAIINHAMKICTDKNVRFLSLSRIFFWVCVRMLGNYLQTLRFFTSDSLWHVSEQGVITFF